jgi:hypothetical protein
MSKKEEIKRKKVKKWGGKAVKKTTNIVFAQSVCLSYFWIAVIGLIGAGNEEVVVYLLDISICGT